MALDDSTGDEFDDELEEFGHFGPLCLSEQVGVRRAHWVHVAKYLPLPRRTANGLTI